jgi:hypothetical protein
VGPGSRLRQPRPRHPPRGLRAADQRARQSNNGRAGFNIRFGCNANLLVNCQGTQNYYGLWHHKDGAGNTYGNNIQGGQFSYNKNYGMFFEDGQKINTWGIYAESNGRGDGDTGYATTPYDYYIGNNCTNSYFNFGVIQAGGHVRLPTANSASIQVWEGGKKLFGDT